MPKGLVPRELLVWNK